MNHRHSPGCRRCGCWACTAPSAHHGNASKAEGMTTDQFVAWLVENEWDDRTNRLIQRLQNRPRSVTELGQKIDYSLDRGLDATC